MSTQNVDIDTMNIKMKNEMKMYRNFVYLPIGYPKTKALFSILSATQNQNRY